MTIKIKESLITSQEKINLVCESADAKKADDILIMEMDQRSSICSYFVVMSASSSVRVKTVADSVEESMETAGLRTRHKEGYADGLWVLLDYGDVIAHVFYEETRRFYNLENLWGDAPRRSWPSVKERPAADRAGTA